MIPIVYVETNWIIACLFPHDQRHKNATTLLEQAGRGECELRVPQIAFIEAEGTMKAQAASFSNGLKDIQNKLQNARNAGFDAGAFTIPADNKYLAYLTHSLETSLENLRLNPAVHHFIDHAEEIAEIGRVKPELKLSTKDMKDLYILCTIVVDRRKQDAQRPALFMNDNHKDFSDEKTKVPQSFYDKHRLLYWRGFKDLNTAVGNWSSKYPNT
jgi:predicted nucleic acid-binding protein